MLAPGLPPAMPLQPIVKSARGSGIQMTAEQKKLAAAAKRRTEAAKKKAEAAARARQAVSISVNPALLSSCRQV